MATTQDEVRIRIAVDNTGVAKGLAGARSQLAGFEAASITSGAKAMTTSAGIIERQWTKTLGSIKNLLKINLAAWAVMFIKWWHDTGAQMVAEKIYKIDELTANDEVMEATRKNLLRAAANRKEIAENIRENWQKAAKLAYEAWEEKQGKKSEKVLQTEKRAADAELKQATIDTKKALASKNALEISKAEYNLELAKLHVIQAQNDLRDLAADKRAKEIAKQNALNMTRREKITEALGSGAFAGELAEIKRLQDDAVLAARAGNLPYAATNQRIAGAKMRQIEQRINAQITPTAKPEDQLINQLMNALAPIKNPDGSLKVTVTNVE